MITQFQQYKYVRQCPTCQVHKTPNYTIREPMVIIITSSKPFEKVSMYTTRPLFQSYIGNIYILTLLDDFSKFAWDSPMNDHKANTVSQDFVTHFVCLYGQPQSLVTDCETAFLSKVYKEVCKLLQITQTSTTPYHQQSNSSLERSHRIR